MLLRKHQPELVRGIRVLDVTETAPMPAFVASPALPQQAVAKLQDAFANARRQPWFGTLAEQLLITGFECVTHETFQSTLEWDRDAKTAGYSLPE